MRFSMYKNAMISGIINCKVKYVIVVLIEIVGDAKDV